MALRFQFNGRRAGRNFDVAVRRHYGTMADRMRRTANAAAGEIKTKGDADIKRGGNFGSRWLASLHSVVEPPRGRTTELTIRTYHDIPYANIHEYGGVIRGKPLLWIPLSWTGIKIRAKFWAARHGGLFRVDRKAKGKKPLLLSIRSKEPKYFGAKSVRLKRRFHLRKIIRETANKMPAIYRRISRRGT